MSTELTTISDGDLAGLKGKVVLLTGGSSGIGLATVRILLSVGARVVNVDRSEPPAAAAAVTSEHGGGGDGGGASTTSSESYQFVKADVTVWTELRAAFEHAVKTFGAIDHVFANAGIQPRTRLVEEDLDASTGLLAEPDLSCIQINLIGVMYTVKLGLYYIQRHASSSSAGGGGSIVLTSSASGFQTFSAGDYAISKHGVIGVMRSLTTHLSSSNNNDDDRKNNNTNNNTNNDSSQAHHHHQHVPIRINCIAPSWTDTAVVSGPLLTKAGVPYQTADVAARSALYLMADEARHGQILYSRGGHCMEIERAMLDSVRQTLRRVPDPKGWAATEDDELWSIMGAATLDELSIASASASAAGK